VLNAHDDPDEQWAAEEWQADIKASSMSNRRDDELEIDGYADFAQSNSDLEAYVQLHAALLLAAGDALLLPGNEALLLAAGDAPQKPESETLLLAASDAPLLPENEALLLAAGDAPLMPENEALLLAAGDAPPLPTEESAPLVGDVDALHVSGENMLGAGAALRRVAVVPPKLIVAFAEPVLAMLKEVAPVVTGLLLDAEVLLLLDSAVPASVYVQVVRASDDYFDQAQLSLKESPLHVGNVLLGVSLAEVPLMLKVKVAVAADVLRDDAAGDMQLQRAKSARLEGGAPRACGAADAPNGNATSDSHLQPHESVLLEDAPAIPELSVPEVGIPVESYGEPSEVQGVAVTR